MVKMGFGWWSEASSLYDSINLAMQGIASRFENKSDADKAKKEYEKEFPGRKFKVEKSTKEPAFVPLTYITS